MTFKNIHLSTNEALVLQQISEHGEDDIISLSRSLGIRKRKIRDSITSLTQKGLITARGVYDGIWVKLSKRGNHLIHYIWPETMKMPAGAF